MHVEHEATDRGRGIAAVVHELRPIGVAPLGDIATEGFQQVERMPVREAAGLQDGMQRLAFRIGAGLAAQPGLHPRKLLELFLGRGLGMIRHVVRSPRETVEGQDRRPQLRPNQAGGNGEVFIPMALARSEIGGARHVSPAMAWARPFHIPPRPRQTSRADCTVNSV